MDVCVSTFAVTLPSTTAAIPLLPCEAMTIRSQPEVRITDCFAKMRRARILSDRMVTLLREEEHLT